MKFRVNQSMLLMLAGSVWIVAGANILRIGIAAWSASSLLPAWKITGSAVIFTVFFFLVFRRLYLKHRQRIACKSEGGCPFSFFDAKSWIVMVCMIALGIAGRSLGWFGNNFISFFYTGLSAALILTGFLFLEDWLRGNKSGTRDRSAKP